MNLTNFHTQSAFGPYHMRTSWLSTNFEAHLPMAATPISYNEDAIDLFSTHRESAFLHKLHREIRQIDQMTKELDEKKSSAKDRKPGPQLQEELTRDYSMIERARKMVALIVEQMQKSMQTISANFR